MIRYFVTAAVLITATLSFAPLGARAAMRETKSVIHVLFLGNSYIQRNNLPRILTGIGESAKPPTTFITDEHTPGACTLERHWQEGDAVNMISSQNWDWVVLQEQSSRPLREFPKMAEYAAKLNTAVREHGAQPAFFMTWAYADKPEMTEGLARAYLTAAEENKARLIPVGLAWRAALDKRPGLLLHTGDNSHPNIKGSYLAACVVYAVLTGRSPVGLSTAGRKIAPEEAAFFQEVAWQTVCRSNKADAGDGE